MNPPPGRSRPWIAAGLLSACLGAGAHAQPVDDGTPAALASTHVLEFNGGALRVELPPVPPARGEALAAWIDEVARALPGTFGRWPLARSWVRISEVDSQDRSPVPWGQTRRSGASPGVLLYVRRDASPAELRADWTAAHEFAHLFHPYLGREGRWLAEGLASYYQNVVRARAGVVDARDAWRELDAGFRRGERDTREGPLAQAGRGETMRVYWAGAAFWLEVDLALRARGGTLESLLAEYAACCLADAPSRDPARFIDTLDRIAGATWLAPLYRRHAGAREFPPLEASYSRLGLVRDGEGLAFYAEGAALRAAIMSGDPAR